jgi:ABC-type uncharacterized transport system involved in gliding motility auxiliary subunit
MKKISLGAYLWIAVVVFGLGLLFARAAAPDLLWLTIVLAVLLVGSIAGVVVQNRSALKGKTAAYGLHSGVTVLLVLGIVGLLNFVAYRYPGKLDWTKNKVHTLSAQTQKVLKEMKKPVKAVLFSNLAQREENKVMLENLRAVNPGNFTIEYVEPAKEPTRARQVGIRKIPTLQLVVGSRDVKVDELNEEKITNALIKLSKDKQQTLCALVGHGEKAMSSQDPNGYGAAKKALENQAYTVTDVNLATEGKIPESCDAVAIFGPTKAYLPQEVKLLQDYLNNGGRAIVALDINLKGQESSPELLPTLASWHVQLDKALVIDPTSKLMGVDAAVPLVVDFSRDHAITKELRSDVTGIQVQCFFPLARPVNIVPGAPAGMNALWLARSTPNSWGETNLGELKTGKVSRDGKDIKGPVNLAVAVEGKQKDSKATRNTRLVVFGSSTFATNQGIRLGFNSDLFMNAASWVLQDEKLISIRSHDDGPGKVELSERAGAVIRLITIVVMPLLIAIAGIVLWSFRRKW